MHSKIKINSKVVFDTDKLEVFIEEMKYDNTKLQKYEEEVLSVIGKEGIVKEINNSFATVVFPGTGNINIPVKYLVLSPPISG
jgi:hypothetical protein